MGQTPMAPQWPFVPRPPPTVSTLSRHRCHQNFSTITRHFSKPAPDPSNDGPTIERICRLDHRWWHGAGTALRRVICLRGQSYLLDTFRGRKGVNSNVNYIKSYRCHHLTRRIVVIYCSLQRYISHVPDRRRLEARRSVRWGNRPPRRSFWRTSHSFDVVCIDFDDDGTAVHVLATPVDRYRSPLSLTPLLC